MRYFSPPNQVSDKLLDWYDKNARDLPWRVAPDSAQRADAYGVWLSEVMLQQTTVATVKGYYAKFLTTWPSVHDLAAAEDGDVMAAWAGLGYYARARNLLKCARVVSRHLQGHFPTDLADLRRLPGIGPYTAAAISAIAFDRPETVVDGNVERVMARFFAHQDPLPKAKAALTVLAETQTPHRRPGDYAQAVMDLGATVCTPRNPACTSCPLREDCQGLAMGIAETLPRKSPKREKSTRFGHVFLAQRKDGAWLLERRPDKGLLGGMLGWPGGDWGDEPAHAPPITADWQTLPDPVRHTFTHFHLILTVHVATAVTARPEVGEFIGRNRFDPATLPTAMRKAFDLAKSAGLAN